jgi:heat induced stress protein YflT
MSNTSMTNEITSEASGVTAVTVPARRTITSDASYQAAERAVDWLSDKGFPVEHVRIVGTGLRYLEQVSGRVTTGRAALIGIAQGGVLGLFWGLLFSLFFTTDSGSFAGVLAFGLAVGIVFGGLVGAVSHSARDGRRDFGSVAETRADHYEVQVDEDLADEAERLLARIPSH